MYYSPTRYKTLACIIVTALAGWVFYSNRSAFLEFNGNLEGSAFEQVHYPAENPAGEAAQNQTPMAIPIPEWTFGSDVVKCDHLILEANSSAEIFGTIRNRGEPPGGVLVLLVHEQGPAGGGLTELIPAADNTATYRLRIRVTPKLCSGHLRVHWTAPGHPLTVIAEVPVTVVPPTAEAGN